jgi:hypothetical protein
MKTVPSLDQTFITLNNGGDVLFAATYKQKMNKRPNQYGNMFIILFSTADTVQKESKLTCDFFVFAPPQSESHRCHDI